MHLERYSITVNEHHDRYEFLSAGRNGVIKKIVSYQQIAFNLYNLAFGDWTEAQQRADDSVRTNNLDTDKVITTVAATVIDFRKLHPNSFIFVKGSSAARTRLYQIGICKHWHIISLEFAVEGLYKGQWAPFEKGKN